MRAKRPLRIANLSDANIAKESKKRVRNQRISRICRGGNFWLGREDSKLKTLAPRNGLTY